MREKTLKRRERLVQSAARRIHRHGYCATSLADVARGARVPPGGIFYYFKSKEALVQGIVDMRLRELDALFAQWETLPSPAARLLALLDKWRGDSEIDARYGCPVGSLCYELAKSGGATAKTAARPLQRVTTWAEQQFAEAGHADAAGLAEHLTMALQGASLVANAMRDPAALVRETDRLKRWLDGL